MWQQLFDLLKQLMALARDTEQNKLEIRELRQELRQLSNIVSAKDFDLRRRVENEAHEREKMALRLENALLRFEHRLPAQAAHDRLPEGRREPNEGEGEP